MREPFSGRGSLRRDWPAHDAAQFLENSCPPESRRAPCLGGAWRRCPATYDYLQAAVAAVEQHVGLRPQRRTALVQARLDAVLARVAERQQACDQIVAQQQVVLRQLGAATHASERQHHQRRQERQIVRLGTREQLLERELCVKPTYFWQVSAFYLGRVPPLQAKDQSRCPQR